MAGPLSFSSMALTKTHHRDTYPAISPTKPSLSQAGKTVLITGGVSGIGFEIARSFAKASAARIIITSRRASALETAVQKLRAEFLSSGTDFLTQQADIGNDSSVIDLWNSLDSQGIFVHVLILNGAHATPFGLTLHHSGQIHLMEGFDINVGGNFLMASKFVKQRLRPEGQQLNLVNVSTAGIQRHPAPDQNPYTTSKAAFAALLGRIADERPSEDVQIISFHPGLLHTEGTIGYFRQDLPKWDEIALPADFSVWAASPEAAWLHGRFVWAHWDVDELRADKVFCSQLEKEGGFLKVAVQGLGGVSFDSYYN
ncbi:short-chain dehydrogenase/reductase [Lentinula raphanica]|uniref:Short-chain dehydrogenase/reductase n=1 Tax=Lentinula raphanica TaxID=153919 RepID=A0AA38UEZ5_9AGAR|nr:short-chain dehydrogenase/reductase [Lentinula raphanica]